MSNMFNDCYGLTTLDLSNFNTSNVTDASYMFSGTELVSLDLSNLDFSKVNKVYYIFQNVNTLIALKSFKNLGKGYTRTSSNYSNYKLDLSKSTQLTHESLMSIINNLYDLNLTYNVANGGTLYTQDLVLGSTNMANLTADEIVIATSKGWTVS